MRRKKRLMDTKNRLFVCYKYQCNECGFVVHSDVGAMKRAAYWCICGASEADPVKKRVQRSTMMRINMHYHMRAE